MNNRHRNSLEKVLNMSEPATYGFFESLISVDDVAYYSGTNNEIVIFNHLNEFYRRNYKDINSFNRQKLKEYFEPDEKEYFYLRLFDSQSLPRTFKIHKNWVYTKTIKVIDKHRIKYVFCDLNYIEYIGSDIEWPQIKSKRIQARSLENFEKHFWGAIPHFSDSLENEEHKECQYLSTIMVNVLTTENRILTFNLFDGLNNTEIDNSLKSLDLISHYQSYAIENFDTDKINFALHLHRNSGPGETGTIDALSRLAFNELGERYMTLFSDIFSSNTARFVSNFKVLKSYEETLLCMCVDSNSLFVIEYCDFIFYQFEDNINNIQSDLHGSLNGANFDYSLIVNEEFFLGSDFIYIDDISNIGRSISLLQDIIRKNA